MDACQTAIVDYINAQTTSCGVSITSPFQTPTSTQLSYLCSQQCYQAEVNAKAAIEASCSSDATYSISGVSVGVAMILSSAGMSAQSPECTVMASDNSATCLAQLLDSFAIGCADPANPSVSRECSAEERSAVVCANQ